MDQSTSLATLTGGEAIVRQLVTEGVTDVFCVPGESYLAVLDALHDAEVKVTICRQEGGAAMMAEAHGKLTGKPGICFVTRGPGATNAAAGVHVAMQDSTPMILFVGQIETGMREREAFQEVDYRAVFGSMAKWVTEIDDADRVPELVARAFHVATSGRPGPVVIALPEDMLVAMTGAEAVPPMRPADAAPSAGALAELAALLDAAERPLIVAGGSGWDAEAVTRLAGFAEAFSCPVTVSFRRQGLFPCDHPNFAGDLSVGANPKLVDYAKASDLVLLLGGRLSEMPSQSYSLLTIPSPSQKFIHVHPGAEEIGRVYRPDLAFNMTPRAFLAGVGALKGRRDRKGLLAEGHAIYHSWSDTPTEVPGSFNLGEVMVALRNELPRDAVVTNGAGNYAIWLHRYYRYRQFGTQLAPTSGSMGFGLPAAVAAKRVMPQKTVVAFAGDGCFLMTGQEFATAVQYDLPVIVVVVDNGMYGTIRMHQEREYPGRVIGTELKNPDFAAYARAFGGHGERVETTAEFMPAFRRAQDSGKPAILHCVTDPEALTPARSLSQIRAASQAAGR
ncbi:thiamine pyrophosphate-binding protein [Cereibacter changlensis]|uniref:thiamine pyrophosphate-binding protein n=1 Tax=Cereibacter changlensis TaxID=402884 RepID=UPI0040338CC7